MRLNIIHLEKRYDRLVLLEEQIEAQLIFDYRLWEGEIIRKSRRTGICKSHKRIVQWAKDNNQPQVIICEDDIRFFAPGAWLYFLEKIPADYDIFFGMIYVGTFDDNNRINSVISGMTLYCVNERFYDKFLSIPDQSHIDRKVSELHGEYKFYVCNPMVCDQNGTYSDHLLSKTDYSSLLKDFSLFSGKKT